METRQEAATAEWNARMAASKFRQENLKNGKWITTRTEEGRTTQHWEYNDPSLTETAAALESEHKRIFAEGIEKFAKPEVADCEYCKQVSVYGGPRHRASSNCRSGRHPHCTCDMCF